MISNNTRIWPRPENAKRLLNRILRKYRRIFKNPIRQSDSLFGYIRELQFGEMKGLFILPSSDIGLSRQLDFASLREWRSTKIFVTILKKRGYERILDLGANLGYFAIIERLFSSAEVVAIEPVPLNFKILQTNMTINEFENMRLIHGAVGVTDTPVKIYEFEHKNWSTIDIDHAMSLSEKGYRYKVSEVPQLNVDNLFETEFQDKFGLIRMDVEGYEYEILMAAEKLEYLNVDIFVEFHSNLLGKEKSLDILNKLNKCGYRFCIIVFNEEFSPEEQVVKYNDEGRVQFLEIGSLIKNLSAASDSEIRSEDGFELFISKEPFDLR